MCMYVVKGVRTRACVTGVCVDVGFNGCAAGHYYYFRKEPLAPQIIYFLCLAGLRQIPPAAKGLAQWFNGCSELSMSSLRSDFIVQWPMFATDHQPISPRFEYHSQDIVTPIP